MLEGDNINVQNVLGLEEPEQQRIRDFLRGAVYCWCKNRKDEWFDAASFLGGENFYWEGTPLEELYKMQSEEDKKTGQAIKKAGVSAGRILKQVLAEDKRIFETKESFPARQYRWTGEER